jgi:hypothetical protein
MHADDGLQAPCFQKVSPARFDIPPTSWTTRIPGSSNLCRPPRTWVHDPTHGFNVRPRFAFNKLQTPPKFAATSLFIPV